MLFSNPLHDEFEFLDADGVGMHCEGLPLDGEPRDHRLARRDARHAPLNKADAATRGPSIAIAPADVPRGHDMVTGTRA